MSRAINLSLPEAEVLACCKTAKVAISSIETLPSGGTHLVCVIGDGAEEIRHRLKKHIIPGRVRRYAYYTPVRPW